MLRKRGKKVLFVTNNATKSRKTFKAKFDQLGMQASVDEVFGSSFATAAYMKHVLGFPEDKYAYIIGMSGIEAEFDAVGIKHKGGTNAEDNVIIDELDFTNIKSDPTIGAVVCGLDTSINYLKLGRAHRYLRENKDCLLILTNDDSTFPAGQGLFFPGAGAISAPLRFALPDKKPIVVGKPNQPMLDSILKAHHLDRRRTIMIGDRLDTDIAFGRNGDITTLMVLTADFEKPDAPAIPDYCINSLGDLAVLAHH